MIENCNFAILLYEELFRVPFVHDLSTTIFVYDEIKLFDVPQMLVIWSLKLSRTYPVVVPGSEDDSGSEGASGVHARAGEGNLKI